MPEATMCEDDCVSGRKHQIGAPRQIPAMKTEPETEGMQTLAQQHLRLCVFATYAAHVEPPLRWREYVHHGRSQVTVASVAKLFMTFTMSAMLTPSH